MNDAYYQIKYSRKKLKQIKPIYTKKKKKKKTRVESVKI